MFSSSSLSLSDKLGGRGVSSPLRLGLTNTPCSKGKGALETLKTRVVVDFLKHIIEPGRVKSSSIHRVVDEQEEEAMKGA